jgi:HlyD family secretion protein
VKVKLLKDSYAQLVDAAHGLAYPFRPGMSATVDIRTNSKNNILTVPIQSVTTRENKDSTKAKAKVEDDQAGSDSKDKRKLQEVVFVVENGKAKSVNVTTGIQDASYTRASHQVSRPATWLSRPLS